MTNQLITYRLPIDYSLTSLMSLISYVWESAPLLPFPPTPPLHAPVVPSRK